jgi:hypothetical protein
MNVRPTDWRDLPVVFRYRSRCLYFDSTLALTRGLQLDWPKAMLSFVAPSTGVFTYLAMADDHADQPVLGRATLLPGATQAHLTYLAPENVLDHPEIGYLLDFMVTQLGEHGAYHVLAEAEDCNQACQILHENGFAVYTRQQIWQLTNEPAGQAVTTPWRSCADIDGINVRSLYNNLTPGLIQQVEPFPSQRLRGMVYYRGGDLLAYVDIKSGPNGVWIQPWIHPEAEDMPARLAYLLKNFPDRRQRPVYLCVRSYQEGVEAIVDALGAQPGPRQAVMVKRLAISRRVLQPAALPVLEGKQAEPTVPIVQVKRTWLLRK